MRQKFTLLILINLFNVSTKRMTESVPMSIDYSLPNYCHLYCFQSLITTNKNFYRTSFHGAPSVVSIRIQFINSWHISPLVNRYFFPAGVCIYTRTESAYIYIYQPLQPPPRTRIWRSLAYIWKRNSGTSLHSSIVSDSFIHSGRQAGTG